MTAHHSNHTLTQLSAPPPLSFSFSFSHTALNQVLRTTAEYQVHAYMESTGISNRQIRTNLVVNLLVLRTTTSNSLLRTSRRIKNALLQVLLHAFQPPMLASQDNGLYGALPAMSRYSVQGNSQPKFGQCTFSPCILSGWSPLFFCISRAYRIIRTDYGIHCTHVLMQYLSTPISSYNRH